MSPPLDERLHLRPVEPGDDAAVARVIRTVMPEFGASGPGFAILDPEVDGMSAAYAIPRASYFVVVERGGAANAPGVGGARGEALLGGAGVAPLVGGASDTCELRKMYLLRSARGRGAGRALLERCLDAARAHGFRRCYLETLTGMDEAMRLYAAFGFTPLSAPEGATGHHGCDRWFARAL